MGMELEAINRRKLYRICTETIAGIKGDNVLITFDG